MGELLTRRRELVLDKESGSTPLLAQGSKTFNDIRVTTSGRRVESERPKSGPNDAYNVKRYFNLTTFADNVTSGTGNTADISNKATGRIIPAGATCVFSASNTSGYSAASYDYAAVLLRNTGTGTIMRIGAFGSNVPAKTATWTASSDTEIGCIALELSHSYYTDRYFFDLSLTVDGEEWLP